MRNPDPRKRLNDYELKLQVVKLRQLLKSREILALNSYIIG